MIKFFTNRELSLKLAINLAKWKRWSREFLPPDPLGGMQSGYARQYNSDEAFTVYLGGLLVSDLKFTIPEAKQILNDLREWLVAKGFYLIAGTGVKEQDVDKLVNKYIIFIMHNKNLGFYYTIRGIISNNSNEFKGFPVRREQYTETVLWPKGNNAENLKTNSINSLNITEIFNDFANELSLSGTFK